MVERQYPPFGQVPSLVEGDHELRLNGPALGALSGVFALPTGILAHLWTVSASPDLAGARYAFERLDTAVDTTDLQVIARVDGSTDAVPANLVSSHGGRDEAGRDARTFQLWFPLPVQAVHETVRLALTWPAASWEAALDLPAAAVIAAASRAAPPPS